MNAIVDCGALASVCQLELAEELGLEIRPFYGPRVVMADGTPSRPSGMVHIKVTTKGGLVAEGDAVVMKLPKLPKLLLGNNFLQQFKKMTIDYTETGPVLTLGALMNEVEPERHVVVTKEDCLVPARSIMQIEVAINLACNAGEEEKCWVIMPSAHLMGKKGLSTGHAVISGRDSQAMMINLTSRPEL